MTRRDEIVIGFFVLAGVAVVVVGSLWLSESRWRGEYRELTARFEDVGQARTGDDVTLRGVEVGEVRSMVFAAGGVDVTLRIREEIPLPPDPVVVLHPISLFGEWGAAVEPASVHPEIDPDTLDLPPGRVPGVASSDFAQLSEHTGAIASNLSEITDRLELALDEETARGFSRTVRNLERASGELAALVREQRSQLGSFSEDLSTAGRTIRESAVQLDSMVRRVRTAVGDEGIEETVADARETTASLRETSGELRGTVERMNRAVARADSALGEAEAILARVNRGEGSLGRIATDPALYEDLSATLVELRALLDDLKRDPGKYFNFSIF